MQEATSPATGGVIGIVAQAGPSDIDRAVEAAGLAWPSWARRPAFERAEAMERVAHMILERRESLAMLLALDQGKPLVAEAYAEVDELVGYFRMAARDVIALEGSIAPSIAAEKRILITRVPRGVVAAITPWNWPYTMPAQIIAPAIAAGNAVVWVPAPSTSVCANALAECLIDAGIPPGIVNVVPGEGPVAGDALAGHPGIGALGFIGSTATGLSVARRAAGKAQLLEMGGNGPFVVLDDADLEAAAKAAVTACFLCAGQSCTAGERLLVAKEIYDEFVAMLVDAVEREVRLGDPFAPDTTMGPLNNERVAEKVDHHIADAVARGAKVLTGGARDRDRPTPLYWQPTVLGGVDGGMEIAREETFGPVAPVEAIDSEEQALDAIDASPFGLLASVFTRDLGRGLRFAERARCGWVNVNESTNYWESHLPFGGRSGSSSGVGRAGGRYAMRDTFTESKTVVLDVTVAEAGGRDEGTRGPFTA
jgi:succinate-semialdehyde dehydrogenase/glutarate-semialdehyde dehydrogenase